MKNSYFALASLLVLGVTTQAQNSNPSQSPDNRQRSIAAPSPVPVPAPRTDSQSPIPGQRPSPGTVVNKPEPQPQLASPTATERHPVTAPAASLVLSPSVVQSRLVEAQRLLKSRPQLTALSVPSIDLVTLTALDRSTSQMHLITIYKPLF